MRRFMFFLIALLTGAVIGALAQGARLRHVNPPGLSTPTGYTHVVVPQRGRVAFIAGQVALDTSGAIVGTGDFRAQAKQVFENLQAAVQAAGATMDDVAKINVYVTDVSQTPALREVRQQYFKGMPPASTLIQVVSLARPEFMLEIEAVVVIE